jgi:hypothetical protein
MSRDRQWLAGFEANAFFLGLELVLLLVAVPLWLRALERGRWKGMRRRLTDAAFAAHLASTEAADAVARQLFRDTGAAPLDRLGKVRAAIEAQRAAAARLGQVASVSSGAVDARLAEVLTGTLDFCARTEAMLAGLVRLYLKEATVRRASNVVHGEDFLGFEDRRIVSLAYVEELERLGTDFAAAAAENRALLDRAMRRRDRSGLSGERAAAEQAVDAFRADLAGFAAQLQPADPDSTEYRSRDAGERTPRTLDQLIARFDRAPG